MDPSVVVISRLRTPPVLSAGDRTLPGRDRRAHMCRPSCCVERGNGRRRHRGRLRTTSRLDDPSYANEGSSDAEWSLTWQRGIDRAYSKPFTSPGASCGQQWHAPAGGRHTGCTGSTRSGALPLGLPLMVGSGRSPSTPPRVNPLPARFARWCREVQGMGGVAGVRRHRVHTESSSRSGAPRPPSRSRRIRSAREVELRTVEAEQSMIRATSSMLRSSQ